VEVEKSHLGSTNSFSCLIVTQVTTRRVRLVKPNNPPPATKFEKGAFSTLSGKQ
jgi:hypothetical protein